MGRASIASPHTDQELMHRPSHPSGTFANLKFVASCLSLAASTQGQDWFRHAPMHAPAMRSSYACAFDAVRGRHVLFGGFDGLSFLDDTWEYDGVAWRQLLPAHRPPARDGHMLFFDPISQRLVLFGGSSSNALLGDTWTFDGLDWTMHNQSNSPPPRFLAPIALFPPTNETFMLGGQQATSPLFLADFWRWNGTDWLLVAATTPVGPRSQAGLVYDAGRNSLILAGGHSDVPVRTFYDDTWAFNGQTWNQLPVGRFAPARAVYAMAFVGSHGRVVLFGGYAGTGSGTLFGDTWELGTNGWVQLTSPAPGARSGCQLVADSIHGTAMLFGGSTFANSGNLDDTWTFGNTNPPTTQSYGSGCSWGGGAPALEATSLPWRGELFEVRLVGLPAGPQYIPALLMGTRAIPPVSLTPFGAPGCLAYLNPLLPLSPAGGVNNGGTATWLLPVPAGMGGAAFDLQGIVGVPAANALGIAVSNALGGVVR